MAGVEGNLKLVLSSFYPKCENSKQLKQGIGKVYQTLVLPCVPCGISRFLKRRDIVLPLDPKVPVRSLGGT